MCCLLIHFHLQCVFPSLLAFCHFDILSFVYPYLLNNFIPPRKLFQSPLSFDWQPQFASPNLAYGILTIVVILEDINLLSQLVFLLMTNITWVVVASMEPQSEPFAF